MGYNPGGPNLHDRDIVAETEPSYPLSRLSPDQLSALNSVVSAGGIVTRFVSPNLLTVAELIATYPANASNLGKYARVSDLYGNVDEIMRCSMSGGVFYWRPQRSDYATESALTTGSMTLRPLITSPVLFVTGAAAANLTITPSAVNAWPGMQFRVNHTGVLGLFSLTLSGLLTSAIPLLQGGSKTLTYTGSGFRAD